MAERIEVLESRIESLRVQVRQALRAGDRELAGSLRRQLRAAQDAWDAAVELAESPTGAGQAPADAGHAPGEQPVAAVPAQRGSETAPARLPRDTTRPSLALPLREQVYQALTLLAVPAAPKLISEVHEAFFAGAIFGARLTSLRRDEERSFRAAPFARPYYLCAALTADLLAPARGLLAISTWPMEIRVIGPLSPRVDFLSAAIRVAEGVERVPDPSPAALRLLWRFATNIPGGAGRSGAVEPRVVAQAAEAERGIHAGDDTSARRAAAQRARGQLDDAQQLFGTHLRVTPRAGTAL